MHEIVEGAKPLYKLAQVRQLYQDMVTARPGDSQVIWLKMGVAIASVHLTDDPSTDAVLQNIIAQHGSDGRAVEVLNHIAWACRNLKQYNKALTIYQYAVNNWPEKDRVAFAQHGIVICQLGLGNPQEADAALNVLLQKFGKDKNISKMVLWAASGYSDAGEVERASKVFELLVQNYPDTQEAVEAQSALAITSVQAEDRNRIEPAIQTLLTKFPPSQTKALGLHNVANTIGWKLFGYAGGSRHGPDMPALFDKCLFAIANYTQATWPGSGWAMWAERDLATAAIQRGDDPNAEAAIGRLTANHATRKDTPAALDFLADYCLELRKHNEAETVYQHLVKAYPTHELILLAKAGLGVVQIRQGNDSGAEAIFQKVLTDYANHPRLAEAINLMAEGYRDGAMAAELEQRNQPGNIPYAVRIATEGRPEIVKSYYRRAIEKWEIIISQLPVSADITPIAYTFASEAYDCIGDSKKALEYFSIVAEQYPAYQHADYALFMVSRTWQRLHEQGVATESQAWPMIVQASETLLNRYPHSEYARIARKTVDWMTATEIRRKERANGQQQN
jgi:TolA-binding protein